MSKVIRINKKEVNKFLDNLVERSKKEMIVTYIFIVPVIFIIGIFFKESLYNSAFGDLLIFFIGISLGAFVGTLRVVILFNKNFIKQKEDK